MFDLGGMLLFCIVDIGFYDLIDFDFCVGNLVCNRDIG